MNVQRTDDGRIVGYRVWYVDWELFLTSVIQPCAIAPDFWYSPVVEAKCNRLDSFHPLDEAPHYKCECGLYAYKEEQRARKLALEILSGLRGGVQSLWEPGVAVGPIYMWGRVVEHENGYRAQYAQVGEPLRVVLLSHGMGEEVLSQRYGVKVEFVSFEDLEVDVGQQRFVFVEEKEERCHATDR